MKQGTGDRGQGTERGFALLLIFFMAAAIALMLYQQMPRVAFESERDKEQLLIDRGEQYKRAILLYYNDYKRFPAKIEDLESTNNHRYLRRRYVDPYTGKDDWRLVHTNGMYLTDSLVQKPPANPANSPTGSQTQTASATGPAGFSTTPGGSPGGAAATGASGTAASTGAPATPNDPNNPPQVNAAVLARPSDRTLPSASGFSGSFQTASNAQPNAPSNTGYIDPASYPPITLFPNGYNAPPAGTQPGAVAPQPGIVQPGGFQPGVQPGISQPGAVQQPGIGQGGQFQPGTPGQLVPVVPSSTNPNAAFQGPPGTNPQPYPINTQPFPANPQTTPASPTFLPGVPQPGVPGGTFPNSGANSPTTFNPITSAPQTSNAPIVDPNNPTGGGLNNGITPGLNQPGLQGGVSPFQGQQAGAVGNAAPVTGQALNLINQILTTPRGSPPPGIGPATATNNNQTVGAGIAGVASSFKGPTIKTYADHSKYEEWEFIFQVQQPGVPGQAANPLGASGTGAGTSGTGAGGIGQPGIGQPGIGQSGFGQPGIGQPGIGPAGPSNIGPSGNTSPGLPPLQ